MILRARSVRRYGVRKGSCRMAESSGATLSRSGRRRFKEGQRLARHRDRLLARGASQPAGSGQEVVTFTQKELEVLQDWDIGQLLHKKNMSIVELGHCHR